MSLNSFQTTSLTVTDFPIHVGQSTSETAASLKATAARSGSRPVKIDGKSMEIGWDG